MRERSKNKTLRLFVAATAAVIADTDVDFAGDIIGYRKAARA